MEIFLLNTSFTISIDITIDPTSSSTRFKKVKHLHQQPITQDGRNQESTFNGQIRLLHTKTQYHESLPPFISRSTIQRLIPLRVERFALTLENYAVRVIDSSSYLCGGGGVRRPFAHTRPIDKYFEC
ncbi:hypothetical protein ACTFIR_003794 [Dictyostelium discoideum]